MKTQNLIAVVIGISGIALIWMFSCWQVALGAFLMLWGNNVQHIRE